MLYIWCIFRAERIYKISLDLTKLVPSIWWSVSFGTWRIRITVIAGKSDN